MGEEKKNKKGRKKGKRMKDSFAYFLAHVITNGRNSFINFSEISLKFLLGIIRDGLTDNPR